MPLIPIILGVQTRDVAPLWLSQGGKGSFPLSVRNVTRAALTRAHRWGAPRDVRDGNGQTFWDKWFFKLDQSGTAGRGPNPLRSRWITRASLTKDHRWASRDYAARKIADEWFFAASGPFGRPVERVRIPNLNGWGSFPLRSRWVTRAALTRAHRFGNDDTQLSTVMEDWFFGRTVGSEDMHILLTLGLYR